MLVARYFMYVGGALLALLLMIGFIAPREAAVAVQDGPGTDKTTIRIHSAQKLPERVVYDTSAPTVAPPAPSAQIAAADPAPVVDATAQARVRETFAQLVPPAPKKPEAQPAPKKRKIARVHPSYQYLPPVRVAQQSHFGFFGGPNSW